MSHGRGSGHLRTLRYTQAMASEMSVNTTVNASER